MFKTNFFITNISNKGNKFNKVSGWGETFESPDGNIIEVRLDKRGKLWYCTEESTGALILGNGYQTRKEALKEITPEILQLISDQLKTETMQKVANQLADFILESDKGITVAL